MDPLLAAARCRRPFWIVVVGLVIGLAAAAADAAIYKYVDRNGDTHYSDSLSSVPDEYRDQVQDISGAMGDRPAVQVVPTPGAAGQPAQARAGPAPRKVDPQAGSSDVAGTIRGLLEHLGFGVLVLALLAIPVLFVMGALIFRLACRLAGEEPPGLGRACVVMLVQNLAGSAAGATVSGVGMLLGLEASFGAAATIGLSGVSFLLSWLASAGVLAAMMGYAFLRSMWIGVLNTLLVIAIVGGPLAAIAALSALRS